MRTGTSVIPANNKHSYRDVRELIASVQEHSNTLRTPYLFTGKEFVQGDGAIFDILG